MRVLGWIFLILIGFGLYGAFSKTGTAPANGGASPSGPVAPQPVAPTVTYADQLKAQLPIIEGFDVSKYTSDVRSIASAVRLMQDTAELIEQGSTMTMSDGGKKDRDALIRTLKAKQTIAYPKLRDAYGPALRKVLWESDGKARTIGSGYRTVELIAGEFASNRNIKSTHEDLHATLIQMRFTRAQYKWVDADVEYTYYKLEPPSDAELVVWSSYGNFRVVH